MGERTDPTTLSKELNEALTHLARDAVAAALAAGTLPGPEGVALSEHLRDVAGEEIRDVERLAARIASLGGSPTARVAAVDMPQDWRSTIESLLSMQRQALDAVVAAIPADADDAEGEATEHLLEHVTARKRDVIELLERALR